MAIKKERIDWEQAALAEPLPNGIICENETISGVDCVWVKTKNTKREGAIIYLHGGGLVAGSAITHRHLAAKLAISCKQAMLLVNYSLLPEHQYPASLNDVLLVYKELISTKGYSPSRLVFGGDSSGAGLVLAALVKLRDFGVSLPRCAFTISGAFDMTLTSESMRNNNSLDPHLSKFSLIQWQEDYLHYDLKSPDLSPVYADLKNLPPLLLLVAGQDPWRCDSYAIAKKINHCDGAVELREWSEMDHVWVMDSSINETEEALKKIAQFIHR